MKSILTLKKAYYREHLNKINLEGLDEDEIVKVKRRCDAVAEARAFIDTLIGEEYRRLTVFDITGEMKGGHRALEPKEALRAKNLVCKYLWGMSWEDLLHTYKTEASIKKYISINSILMRRYNNGCNVAIYGGENGPCGRTMLASIILKEAIRMRLFVPGLHSQTYDWVEFPTLVEDLRERSDAIPDYKTADWLVVDKICLKDESSKQVSYKTNLLDPFFTYRFKNKLPTILVFQYDIRLKTTPMYKKLGTGIADIMNSSNICRIPLNRRN